MKGKIISFMNMKGGVCKTTLCANIANTLATKFKKSVLVIDVDPQFNATQYMFGVLYNNGSEDNENYNDNYIKRYEEFKKAKKTIFQLYNTKDKNDTEGTNTKEKIDGLFNINIMDNHHLKKNYIVNLKPNLDMLLGDVELIDLQISQKSGTENILKNYIDINKLREKYQYILIDSPPTYSIFFISSYIASDAYIVPIKPDFMSSLGMVLLTRAKAAIKDAYNKEIPCLGIVYTLIDPRNNIHIPIIKDIESVIDKKHIFSTEIKYLKPIPDGVRTGKFMIDINEQDISKNIIKITEEFISRVGGIASE